MFLSIRYLCSQVEPGHQVSSRLSSGPAGMCCVLTLLGWQGDRLWLRAAVGPQRGWADAAGLCLSVTAQLLSAGVTHRLWWECSLLLGEGWRASGWAQQGRGSLQGAVSSSHTLAGSSILFCSFSLGS